MLKELLQKRDFLTKKKDECFRQYWTWVDNALLNTLAWVAIWDIVPSKLLFGKEEEIGLRIIGYFLLSFWLLIGVFILYKMLSSLPLSKKIQKLSQKITEIDKEIVEELKKL